MAGTDDSLIRPARHGRRRRFRRLGLAAQNALEIVRAGRLGAKYGAPFLVMHEDARYRLRHFEPAPGADAGTGARAPLLLIPPLMVAADVYDIDPDVSAVGALTRAGVDVWMVDYGAPERTEGGMSRTLDDHVLAVSDAVDRVRTATGNDVHLAGYSQGGMFAYQAAGYRRSDGIGSVITFGSPVDIHRNLPNVRDDLTGRMIGAARAMLTVPLARTGGLPGKVTSTGFRLLSARKEAQQMIDFLRKLHDRQALEKRESRRLFLGGEGFVAWPGPALRTFIDEVLVKNRLASGGFVIGGRTVTLADITCPILYFVGLRDDMARPPSVRAIREAAASTETFGVEVKAGHFGLVVGSTALAVTWPTVIEWLAWQAGSGRRPSALPIATPELVAPKPEHDPEHDEDFETWGELQYDVELFYDVATKAASAAWHRLGDLTEELGDAVDGLRWQMPRLGRLGRLRAATRVSLGLELARQAKSIPERTFFLFRGRAFSYEQANRRVEAVVRGLLACGVAPGQRVGVVMQVRPSYLSIVAALSRIGAVAVLVPPTSSDEVLASSLEMAGVERLVADPDNAPRSRAVFDGDVLVLGGGPDRAVPEGVRDLEKIDPDQVRVPQWYRANRGRADDLAMIIIGTGRTGQARGARITNRRWAFSAYGAAAACTLTPADTVYCCLPLHHAAGALVAAGGALVGGARMALSTAFRPDEFWPEVRRYGATVVFYAGEMCRALVDAPHAPAERNHPVRLFAGSGMRIDVWNRLSERFGTVGILEFYASTEGNAVLANAAGKKIGALGRPLPGSSELALVEYDPNTRGPRRGPAGHCTTSGIDQVGLLLARIDAIHPIPGDPARDNGRIVRDVFSTGDAWFVTGDLMRRDADGDYWFVDHAVDAITTPEGSVFTHALEDVLYRVPEVALACAYGVQHGGEQVLAAALVMRDGASVNATELRDALAGALPRYAWPRFVRVVEEIPMTAGYRPLKALLRTANDAAVRSTLTLDPHGREYQ